MLSVTKGSGFAVSGTIGRAAAERAGSGGCKVLHELLKNSAHRHSALPAVRIGINLYSAIFFPFLFAATRGFAQF